MARGWEQRAARRTGGGFLRRGTPHFGVTNPRLYSAVGRTQKYANNLHFTNGALHRRSITDGAGPHGGWPRRPLSSSERQPDNGASTRQACLGGPFHIRPRRRDQVL